MAAGSQSAWWWLVRHGETDDNRARIFQGQSGRGLNRLGRRQAERLAERLRHVPLTAIVASDLPRAEETAHVLAATTGVSVELDPGLREVDVGKWTGKSYEQVAVELPDEWAAWEAGLDLRRGGGETYAELAERIDRALERIARRHAAAGARIVVVSHGGAIKSWVMRLLAGSPVALRALGAMDNCGLTLVERDARGGHCLRTWNDVAHLTHL